MVRYTKWRYSKTCTGVQDKGWNSWKKVFNTNKTFDISSNSWYQNIVNSISKSDLSYSLFKEIDT